MEIQIQFTNEPSVSTMTVPRGDGPDKPHIPCRSTAGCRPHHPGNRPLYAKRATIQDSRTYLRATDEARGCEYDRARLVQLRPITFIYAARAVNRFVPTDGAEVHVVVSDIHFGKDSREAERSKEDELIRCLRSFEPRVGSLTLLGDVFECYIEHRHLVPKGWIRFQGLLAEWSDGSLIIKWTQYLRMKETAVKSHMHEKTRPHPHIGICFGIDSPLVRE